VSTLSGLNFNLYRDRLQQTQLHFYVNVHLPLSTSNFLYKPVLASSLQFLSLLVLKKNLRGKRSRYVMDSHPTALMKTKHWHQLVAWPHHFSTIGLQMEMLLHLSCQLPGASCTTRLLHIFHFLILHHVLATA